MIKRYTSYLSVLGTIYGVGFDLPLVLILSIVGGLLWLAATLYIKLGFYQPSNSSSSTTSTADPRL